VILSVRIAFQDNTPEAFPELILGLVADIASRVPASDPSHAEDPLRDECGIKVVSFDEDDPDSGSANSGIVQLAIPLAVAPPEHGLPLLLAIAGYGSVFSSVREFHVLDLEIPDAYLESFSGPANGAEHIFGDSEELAQLGIVLRPRFHTSKELLAEYVREHVAAGVDFIFDDELTVGTSQLDFDARISTVVEAIDAAAGDRDRRPVYIANVLASHPRALELARRVLDDGADGIMVNPIVMGYDAIQELAGSDEFGGLVVANFIGRSLLTGGKQFRISPVLLCKLARLAGADAMYIQPFAGTIRNPRQAAALYESALCNDFSPKQEFRKSVGVMSGGLALTEYFTNQEIYKGPLMLTLSERCAQAWESEVRPGVVFECIGSIKAAMAATDQKHLEQTLVELSGRSQGHRQCLEILGIDGLA
jgi:ribulose 1,5-bisphosphate carboxylase large subunit-like protein